MVKKIETEKEIIYEGDLILTEDFKSEKNLIVHGNIRGKDGKRYNIKTENIDAWDIHVWNIKTANIDVCNIDAENIKACDINANDIDAWSIHSYNINANNINTNNINAWDIICNERIKKTKNSKTIAYSLIQNRYARKKKEQMKE